MDPKTEPLKAAPATVADVGASEAGPKKKKRRKKASRKESLDSTVEQEPLTAAPPTKLSGPELGALKDKVRDRIVAASVTGHLAQVLQEKPEEEPVVVQGSINSDAKAVLNRKGSVLSPGGAYEWKDGRAIIVWGARGLRRADYLGNSASYCIARVGPVGSPWSEKPRGSGRRSEVVRGTCNPDWYMGFPVDVWGMKNPEVQIRVYGKDWAAEDDFLGEARAPLDRNLDREALTLSNGRGFVVVSADAVELLDQQGIGPSPYFEALAPIGQVKSCRVEDITEKGPLRVGTAPLPPPVRGVFWLTGQGGRSALVSFGGASRDCGGCSTGELDGNRYKIRVHGDRTWANAGHPSSKEIAWTRWFDLVYHIVVDHPTSPKRLQMYPEAKRYDAPLIQKWLLDFEMRLVDDCAEFPGSVVWKRVSGPLRPSLRQVSAGNEVECELVQVMDEDGQRIQPAWSKFAEYQNSVSESPGVIWYRDIESS